MHNCPKIILAVLFLSAILGVTACGKMSDPVTIEGSGYPHDYPRQ